MSEYNRLLAAIVGSGSSRGTIDAISTPDDLRWAELTQLIDEDVLIDAAGSGDQLRKIFFDIQLDIKPIKTMARIVQKTKEQHLTYKNYFKSCSDLSACRVTASNLTMMRILIHHIEDVTIAHGGKFHIRKPSFWNDRQYVDIVQYVYVYLPQLGHIVEMQIGHPFALYTFKADSCIRDGGDVVDLWADGFYTMMKQHMLEGFNGTPYTNTFEQCMDVCNRIHNGNTPLTLLDMLV